MTVQERSAKERRPLLAGLKGPVDPEIESAFVHADKPKPAMPAPAAEARGGKGQGAAQVARAPLTIRFRAEIARALKEASLRRQLSGETPNSLQDILEEAVEPWLRSRGYLT